MSEKIKFTLISICVALAFVLFNSLYVLPQTEQAIVLQFGEPVRLVKDAGLKLKLPFIQNVVFYVDVDSFTRFRIIDPLKFYQTVRTEEQARSKLKEIVNSSVRKILGRTTLQELLSQKRTQIMADISNAVKVDAAQIGVSVADVRIRRADLPIEVLQAINARMKTERERDAKEFRAQGQQNAQQIRAKAEKEKTIIIAEAAKKAEIMRGEGDQEAIRIWNQAANRDPQFFAFYRSLAAYQKALNEGKTSLVLSPDSEFFRYFQQAPKSIQE